MRYERWLYIVPLKLRSLFRRRRVERELDDELRYHLDQQTSENIAKGMGPGEARQAALRVLGGLEQHKEASRDARGLNIVDNLGRDVRYASRGLARNPAFACASVLTLALGIGINTGIFSILNGIALRPLPSPRAEELVTINQTILRSVAPRPLHGSPNWFSTSEYRTYRDNNQTLTGLAAIRPAVTATLRGEPSSSVIGQMVTCNYFEVLERPPAQGPGFKETDCAPGAEASVVLGHGLWSSRFGADLAILGQSVVLNRQRFRVVGIAEQGFRGVDLVDAAFWAPIEAQPILDPGSDLYSNPDAGWLVLLGRRRSGAGLEDVRAELSVVSAQIDQQQAGRETALLVLQATFLTSQDDRQSLSSLAAVVMAGFGLVLLIACANVTNLLLVRIAGRRKEIGMRLSLGATRGRLIQQLLTESLLLGLAGGVLGLALAAFSAQSLVSFVISYLPVSVTFVDASVDLRVMWFAVGVTLLTVLVIALLPSLQGLKADLHSFLKLNSAGSGRPTIGWLRGGLVSAQVAVCIVLMIAVGLLMRGMFAVQTLEPGFDYDDVAVVSMDMVDAGYDAARAVAFQTRLIAQIRGLPGIDQVAQAGFTPLDGRRRGVPVIPEGGQSPEEVWINHVSDGYFQTLGIPIIQGRDFTPGDMAEVQSVILSQSTALRFWPGENPLTKTVEFFVGPGERRLLQVVGITADSQVVRIAQDDTPFLYLPIEAAEQLGPSMQLGPGMQPGSLILVRSGQDFADTATAIRVRAAELDPDLAVSVNRLEENLDSARAQSQLVTVVSGSLAALALVLASLGVYGVVSYVVGLRLREIGISMMLGATPRVVRSMILVQGLRPVLVGVVIGGLISAGVSRILESVLFGVSAYDPAAFIGAPLALITVAAVASLVPARRAVNVDPVTMLRYD